MPIIKKFLANYSKLN